MTPEQFSLLQASINTQIKATVNGKIDHLTLVMEDHIKSDTLWKSQAMPAVELGTNVRGFGKVVAYLLGVGAGLYALIKIIKS